MRVSYLRLFVALGTQKTSQQSLVVDYEKYFECLGGKPQPGSVPEPLARLVVPTADAVGHAVFHGSGLVRSTKQREAATMATTNVLTPATWAEIYEALFADTFNPRTERFKSRFAYRGVSSSTYGLETSLMRLGGEYPNVEPHSLQ